MKQIPKQKWILSTLLVAALGSQYYFSTSSKNVGAFDLASEAPNAQIQALVDVSAALQRTPAPGAVAVSGDLSRSLVAAVAAAPVAASADATRVAAPAVTQGAAQVAPCGDCVLLTKAEAERIRQILVEVTGKKPVAEVAVEETAAEKRKRLREEKEQKKIDDAQAKADKLRDEKDARNDEFKDKMEDIASKCDGEITCLTSRYTSLLARYSGKKKIDSTVAQAAYRVHIEKVLKASMSDESKSESVAEALASLGRDVPNEYRQVKESAILAVKNAVSEKAISANKNFRLSEQLTKAGKINESISIGQQAETDATDATGMANLYSSTLNQSLKDVSDSVSLAYMNKLTPEVQRLLSNMRLTTGAALTTTDTTTNPLINPNQGTTRGVVRGGDASTTPSAGTNNTTNTGNALNGVQFGNTQTGGARGSRGSYQQ
ncbi:MAG: hypothetical protein ABL930_01125 [Pseudobdellovibrio sp.]